MMRRAKVNYLDKEDMMGHSVGLERHYERYQEDDFERFPEYQKAIPFLTISDEERQKERIQSLELQEDGIKEIKKDTEKIARRSLEQDKVIRILNQKLDEQSESFMQLVSKFMEKERQVEHYSKKKKK